MDYAKNILSYYHRGTREAYRPPAKPVPMPITRAEIFELCKPLDDYRKSVIYGLYLSAARASEFVQIQTKDFEIVTTPDGERQVKLHLNTRKKRAGVPFRDIPLKSNNDIEREMLLHLMRHKATFERLGRPMLFPFQRKTLWKKLHEIKFQTTLIHFAPLRTEDHAEQHLYPHFLRHCRATHLVTDYGFNAFQLQNYLGWSSVLPASVYVNLDWREASKLLLGIGNQGQASDSDRLESQTEKQTIPPA